MTKQRAVEVLDLYFCHTHGTAHPQGQWSICHGETWSAVVRGEVASDSEEPQPITDEGTLILSVSDLAYIRTVEYGLVPCKVTAIDPDGMVAVRITADRGDWVRGKTEAISNPRLSLVKRQQVSVKGDETAITEAFLLLATEEGVFI